MVEFLEFLVMLVIPEFRQGIVSWVWKRPSDNSLRADAVVGAASGAMTDLCRSKRELVLENALLRRFASNS